MKMSYDVTMEAYHGNLRCAEIGRPTFSGSDEVISMNAHSKFNSNLERDKYMKYEVRMAKEARY